MNWFQAASIVIAVVAAGWDLATRRIPNALTFGSAALAILVHTIMAGWSGAGLSVGGWLLGVALFFPFFALGGMGAGDVKLLGALGAWLGPVAVVWVALFASLAGGVLAVVVALCSGYLSTAFNNLWCLLMHWRLAGPRPLQELTLSAHKGPRLAYAVPVLAGVALTVWLK